jgi:hypothetical protein
MGTALLALGRDAEAAQQFGDAVALRLAAGATPAVVAGWQLNQAVALAGPGRMAEADALVRATASARPADDFDRAMWALLRASVRLRQDRPAESLAQAADALPFFATQANRTLLHRLQQLRAGALLATGQPDAALQALDGGEGGGSSGAGQAVDLAGLGGAEVAVLRARALLALGRTAAARSASSQALQTWQRLRPGSHGHGLALGWHAQVLRAAGDGAGADAAARQALALIGPVHRSDERALVEHLTAHGTAKAAASTIGQAGTPAAAPAASAPASSTPSTPSTPPARSLHATTRPLPPQDHGRSGP